MSCVQFIRMASNLRCTVKLKEVLHTDIHLYKNYAIAHTHITVAIPNCTTLTFAVFRYMKDSQIHAVSL